MDIVAAGGHFGNGRKMSEEDMARQNKFMCSVKAWLVVDLVLAGDFSVLSPPDNTSMTGRATMSV